MGKGEKNNYGFRGSIGAGVSVSNIVEPRALFGGGMSFGKKHMLAIDLGAIAGYADKKSNQIREGEDYLSVPSTIVVSRTGLGAFISIGYLYRF